MELLKTLCFLLFCFAVCKAEDDELAQIVGIKRILNNLIVKGRDLTVQYDIYNIGKQTAENVELHEDGFPADYFSLKSGSARVRWTKLAAGSNVSHTLVLTPQQSVVFNVSQATLRYRRSAETRGYTLGHTAGTQEVVVYDDLTYERQFSAHATEWLSFGLMTIPSILIPLALWRRSNEKYASLQLGAKKSD